MDVRSDYARIEVAFAVAALHVLFGYVLITALGIEIPSPVRDNLKIFEVGPEPPPPPVGKPVPRRAKSEKRKGTASPPNLKAKPAEVVAVPPRERPLIVPPPVVAAPTPGPGSAPTAGAADVPGPGTGSGGHGAGTGGGGKGDGDGDYTPPRWLRGRIKDSDYPLATGETGIGETITVRFTVETDGHVTQCIVIQSSGNPRLDDATCRLIERRYRFAPSRDAHGTPVSSAVVEDHTWMKYER